MKNTVLASALGEVFEERSNEFMKSVAISSDHVFKHKVNRKKIIKTAVLCALTAAAVFYISSIFICFERLVGTDTTVIDKRAFFITHNMSKTEDINLFVDIGYELPADNTVILDIAALQNRFEDENPHYDIENMHVNVKIIGEYSYRLHTCFDMSVSDQYKRLRWDTYDTTKLTGSFGYATEWFAESESDYCRMMLILYEAEGPLEVHVYLDYDIVGKGLYAWNVFRGQSQEIVYTIENTVPEYS